MVLFSIFLLSNIDLSLLFHYQFPSVYLVLGNVNQSCFHSDICCYSKKLI